MLAIATLNYSLLLHLALSKDHRWRAFLSICCNRLIGLLMASMAWRLPVSWGPSVCTSALFISARGAVHAARVFQLNDPRNPYVQLLCGMLNSAVARFCRTLFAGTSLVPGGAGIFLPCNEVGVTDGHTVLLIWLAAHLLGFWSGFLLALRDEVSDRKAFLLETRQQSSHFMKAVSIQSMMLQMFAVQLFCFVWLLFLGNDL